MLPCAGHLYVDFFFFANLWFHLYMFYCKYCRGYNIYMELTEFYHILPHPLLNNSLWIRYVNDIFVSLPHNTNPNDVLNYINSIHPSVQYTIEMLSNNSIPFLDTLITWNNNHLQFTIYGKPTFAPNYIHWLSNNHSPNTKLAFLSSLFLRAFRICTPPLLAQETKYIHNTFKSLYYPEFFITKAFNKAKKRYYSTCLLYTSDAADERSSVDLGGRRIIKKKKK